MSASGTFFYCFQLSLMRTVDSIQLQGKMLVLSGRIPATSASGASSIAVCINSLWWKGDDIQKLHEWSAFQGILYAPFNFTRQSTSDILVWKAI
jgi:hypothetical protein